MQGTPGLVREEDRYRLLVDAVTDYAIYMLDPEGRISSWNAGARRMKGYEASEILGQHFSRFYTSEDREQGRPHRTLETATREGRFEAEGWRVRKNGDRFWAHVIVDAIRGEHGELLGFAKVTRDLTERREAEQALRRSEAQFRLLVQGVTDYAIYMLDPEGRVTNWNLGAQRIKGYAPDEIVGSHFSRFYTDEDREAGLPQVGLSTALREGRFEKEGWRVRKDGQRFWANVVIDPIWDDDGGLLGYAKITRDISERREAQMALEKAREAAFQAQKMEAIGQLTGGVAHDFNNLLMAILGSLDLLRKRLPSEARTDRLIDNASQAAQRGASLIQRMLAFARRQALTLTPVDVAALIEGMSELLDHSLGGAVKVRTEFPTALRPVLADPNQLELAVLNLAVNARDAMPIGGEVVIAGREENLSKPRGALPPGPYVLLSVSDTGTGMDKGTLARATEPFFTTKGVGKGTGLGLSMVQGTVEQLGGALLIDSAEGLGTTIELWLPVAAATDVTPDEPLKAPVLAEVFAEGPSVLLIDDDPLVLLSAAGMLEDLGCHVVTAESGSVALQLIEAGSPFDLLITDHAMPGMTGLQLAHIVRERRPDLPILIASGFAELPKEAGEHMPRLAKPFGRDDLMDAVGRLLGKTSKQCDQ
ncbi:PAS domain S-box protein [Chelatococcus sambhunathii]|uniref:histidine kinase n=1 Tax=Chelatococcus sambhunathii TaxID=363953 RepID=A0ABU1DDB5_9HYPH|nr:PAS domain S-box protein [Chelatococcus sambhunathii]MDR4306082.1 PAS domain S-box protein [Chelatococcus sambhunathii]